VNHTGGTNPTGKLPFSHLIIGVFSLISARCAAAGCYRKDDLSEIIFFVKLLGPALFIGLPPFTTYYDQVLPSVQ